jgi:hypothetical protein
MKRIRTIIKETPQYEIASVEYVEGEGFETIRKGE